MAAEGRWGARQCVLALAVLLVAGSLGRAADAYIIFVESKECLTQHIESGDSITGSFVVVDVDSAWSEDVGGIDFWIDGPNNYKMYSVRNKADDTFQIRAVHSGDYKFCMENVEHMAASVDLNFHVGHHAPMKLQDVAKEDHIDEVYQQLVNIENDVWDIIQTQEHFKARDLRRKKTNESTSRRVIWYALLETFVLVAACGAQLFILRRLFEKKAMKFSA